MATYSPNGRGHRTLAALAHGSRLFDHLRAEACAVNCAPSKRAKYSHLTRAMKADGLIETGQGWMYAATDLGLNALDRLERGETVIIGPGVPNVRVFAQREASA